MNLKNIISELVKLIDPEISISNIATLNDGDEFLETKSSIVLSVVNIQEDKTLKNQSVYNVKKIDKTVEIVAHPPQYLNISLLFTSYSKEQTKYLDGLEKLQNIIEYFQINNSFYFENITKTLITYFSYKNLTAAQKENYSKITLMSVSLTMEQLNQMWSYLGSKYMPSILFEMRVLPIQKNAIEVKKAIEEIEIDLWKNDLNDPGGLLESVEFPKP